MHPFRHDAVIRPLRPDDAPEIVALYAACMSEEPDIGPITAEGWAAAMRLARFGYGRDFLVALDGTELIGLAESSLREGGTRLCRLVKILVHPSRRRRGLGTRLLQALMDQGPSDAPLLIESLPRPHWMAGVGFASHFGFTVMETEIIMGCPTFHPIAAGPAGVEITRVEAEAGADRVAEIHNAAYRDEAGFVRTTGSDMLHSLDDAQLWTAQIAGAVVAFAIIEQEADLIWLESLAVDPCHQGRGIGGFLASRALVSNGIGEGRSAGLSVSSSNGVARKLYARLGFEKRSEKWRYGVMRDELLARMTA